MMKPGQKAQCLALLHAPAGQNELLLHTTLFGQPLCERSMVRVHATRIVLQSLLSRVDSHTPLWFWYVGDVRVGGIHWGSTRQWQPPQHRIDFTDSTVMTEDMREYLHYPILTFGMHC